MARLYQHIVIIISLSILLSGCDFGDINIDPTTLPEVPASLILPNAEAQTIRNLGSIGGRLTGTMIQHFKGIEGVSESQNDYLIDEEVLDTYWRTGLYSAAMRDCHIIIAKSDESPHFAGIAKILMAVNLGIATSFWGDVPYSEAFLVDNFLPRYDQQELIYEEIQQLLDEAILLLNQDVGLKSPVQFDLIFKGNQGSWIKTALALKARYYLHLIKRDEGAAMDVINLFEGKEIMTSNEVPWFYFGESQNEANPLGSFGADRPAHLVMGGFLLNLMLDSSDPRIEKYTYRDSRINEYLLYEADNEDLFWTQFDSPLPIISRSEVLFILAESHLRIGNLSQSDAYLQEAILSNMLVLGVQDYDIYLDNVGSVLDQQNFSDQLQLIIEQKYIAMFSQSSIEAWIDYRRTGFPELSPSPNANESFNPSKIIPRRFLYPISERNTNNANLQEALDRQGVDFLDVDLWAFK